MLEKKYEDAIQMRKEYEVMSHGWMDGQKAKEFDKLISKLSKRNLLLDTSEHEKTVDYLIEFLQ